MSHFETWCDNILRSGYHYDRRLYFFGKCICVAGKSITCLPQPDKPWPFKKPFTINYKKI